MTERQVNPVTCDVCGCPMASDADNAVECSCSDGGPECAAHQGMCWSAFNGGTHRASPAPRANHAATPAELADAIERIARREPGQLYVSERADLAVAAKMLRELGDSSNSDLAATCAHLHAQESRISKILDGVGLPACTMVDGVKALVTERERGR